MLHIGEWHIWPEGSGWTWWHPAGVEHMPSQGIKSQIIIGAVHGAGLHEGKNRWEYLKRGREEGKQ